MAKQSALESDVGVLMCVYRNDKPADFERSLLSITEQTLCLNTSLNIYLGVDGPIGEDLEHVITKYQGCFHQILRNEENKGLACMLNRLIEARGTEEYLFRMDSDDISLPVRFEKQINYMEAHPEVDILGTDIIEVDKQTGRRHIVKFSRPDESIMKRICKGSPVAHPTVCFRSRVFDVIDGYCIKRYSQDLATWFECLKRGLVFDNLHEPLLEFSIENNFWNRRSSSRAWNEFTIYVNGIWSLWGFTWRLVFPVLRLILRLLPKKVVRIAYKYR